MALSKSKYNLHDVHFFPRKRTDNEIYKLFYNNRFGDAYHFRIHVVGHTVNLSLHCDEDRVEKDFAERVKLFLIHPDGRSRNHTTLFNSKFPCGRKMVHKLRDWMTVGDFREFFMERTFVAAVRISSYSTDDSDLCSEDYDDDDDNSDTASDSDLDSTDSFNDDNEL